MTTLKPIIGPGWSEPEQKYVENADEQCNRFTRAQSRWLFMWRRCGKCGEDYRKDCKHECKEGK